jgi:hypothetical protein
VTFEAHLAGFSPADWTSAVDTLASEIHPVDLDATRIWLAFFSAARPAALAATMGDWRLEDNIDSSHTFLYGHRYWPQAKRAVLAMSAESSYPALLPEIITKVADHTSRTSSVDRDQLIGIATAGLMTLRQCGIEKFGSGKGVVQLPMDVEARSIRQVMRRRRLQRSRGLLALLLGRRNRFRMTFDENVEGAAFDVMSGETIADRAPSGTSWIGILAGADELMPGDHGVLRLASETRPRGDMTLVIPPWSRKLRTTT